MAVPSSALAAETLPKLGADRSQSSVSGLSSGAFMTVQIHVAHSSDIVGAGVVAGGPFACAESAASKLFPFWPTAVAQNATQALYQCMQTTMGEPDPDASVSRAKELAEAGAIDPLAGLAGDNVYLFSGNEDQTVTRPVVQAAADFYRKVGIDPDNIALIEQKGGHAFITEQGGAACGISATPYVSDCDYNQAKAILAWIYGPLEASSPEPSGQFIPFDQGEFAGPADGMADEGVVYVPKACADQPGCRIHVALHGCEQSREAIGDTFIKESGFAEIADQNRLVILFPQVKASTVNPKGCWDWWGYTGLDYLGKDAPQIEAIWAMVERLSSKLE
jgi:poly(3-hydroxybutyrate) depolymerase